MVYLGLLGRQKAIAFFAEPDKWQATIDAAERWSRAAAQLGSGARTPQTSDKRSRRRAERAMTRAMAFEAVLAPDAASPSRWRRVTVIVSLAVHVAALAVGVAYSFWQVDELPLPPVSVTLRGAAAPAAAARAAPLERQGPPEDRGDAEAAAGAAEGAPEAAEEKPKPEKKEEDEGKRAARRAGSRAASWAAWWAPRSHRAQDAGREDRHAAAHQPQRGAIQGEAAARPRAATGRRAGVGDCARLRLGQGTVTDVRVLRGADPAIDPQIPSCSAAGGTGPTSRRASGAVLLQLPLRDLGAMTAAREFKREETKRMDFSLVGLWGQMGAVAKAVVVILLGMSMYAIGIALERFLTYRRVASVRSATSPRCSRWSERGAAAPGGGAAQEVQGRARGPGDRPGHDRVRRRAGQPGRAARDPIEVELLVHGVTRSMERAKKREVASLQRGLPVLATISSSAPFVGLFGTVFGIITAFQQMADPSKGGGGGLASVSAGIAEALLTTAVGLGVAIVAVWFYNFFVTKLEQFGALIDDTAGELADRLVKSTRAPRPGAPGRASRRRSRRERPGGAAARVRAVHGEAQGGARPQVRADINVTPLVDVVLVLLIIFMVVTPLIASGVAVDLPRTAHHSRKPDDGKDIIVSVTADKRFYIGTARLDQVEELARN